MKFSKSCYYSDQISANVTTATFIFRFCSNDSFLVQGSPLVERRQIGSWQKHLKVARSYDKLVHQLKYIYTSYAIPHQLGWHCSDGRKMKLILT